MDQESERYDKNNNNLYPIIFRTCLGADAFALYTKAKNFHCHLYGSHFRDYHLLLDEHADAIFESIDIMAERVLRVGGTTIRSISHIGQLQTIEDDNSEVVPT